MLSAARRGYSASVSAVTTKPSPGVASDDKQKKCGTRPFQDLTATPRHSTSLSAYLGYAPTAKM